MRRTTIVAVAVLLAACNSQSKAGRSPGQDADASRPSGPASATPSPSALVTPDLAACPARELLEEGLRQRTRPIPVPPALRVVMRSDMDNFAFSTLGGAIVCIDASWMERVDNAQLSPDERFVSFDWVGYEAFGHVIVDRSGRGSVLDTGVQPVVSPSGRLMAAADLSESGYGALNAFAVWQIEPTGLRQLARHEENPPATEWKIERWAGEDCIDLSAVLWNDLADSSEAGDPPRRPYRARQSKGWRLESGRCSAG